MIASNSIVVDCRLSNIQNDISPVETRLYHLMKIPVEIIKIRIFKANNAVKACFMILSDLVRDFSAFSSLVGDQCWCNQGVIFLQVIFKIY